MKEYMIYTDIPSIEFGVYAVSENEARQVAEDIITFLQVTKVVECQTPVVEQQQEKGKEMANVYKVNTNLSMFYFEVIADSEDDAIHTGEVILNQLVVRDVEKGVEVH